MQITLCMKRLLINIATYTMFLLLLWIGIAFTHTGEALNSPAETLMLELINAARQDPLAMAERVGWPRDQVLANFPDKHQLLLSGLPLLRSNCLLHASAAGHGRDMLQQVYYSYVSPDGRNPSDRMREQGYAVHISGESLGLISFGRYIDPLTVAAILFNNLYYDELNPAWQGERNILNPAFKDVGISIQAGIFHLGAPLNVYVLTADFGVRKEYLAGIRLHQQINALRRDPLPVLQATGIDEATARSRLGAQGWILDYGLPPLAWRDVLYRAAQDHAEDMAFRGYFSSITPEGLDPLQRMVNAGYFTLYGSEVLARPMVSPAASPDEMAATILTDLLHSSFFQYNQAVSLLLSPKLTETGIGIAPDPHLGVHTDVGLLVAASVARPDQPQAFLMGNVYQFAPSSEPGLPDAVVAVEGAGVEIHATDGSAPARRLTGILGEYQLPLPRGNFELRVLDSRSRILVSRHLHNDGSNMSLDIHLDQ